MRVQDQVKLLKADELSKTVNVPTSDVYGGQMYGYWNEGYRTDYNASYNEKFERDDKLEEIEESLNDMWMEIETQFEHDLNKVDFKAVLRGIKSVIINQLSKGNSRKWKKWQEDASYQASYQGNLHDIFGDWGTRGYHDIGGKAISATRPLTQPTTIHTTQYSQRPIKKLKWELVIRPEIATFIKKMMNLNKTMEWGIAFTWTLEKEVKQLVIDRLYLMPVTTSGGHVSFINESEYLIFREMSQLGEFVTDIGKDRFAGIMHSHHNMGSWHSSTDHGTIKTYIGDFESVLSIVWAWKGKDSPITADVILKSKDDGFTIEKFNLEQDLAIDSEELTNLDNPWVDKYNDMIVIVKRDLEKYKSLLNMFEKSKKFLKINDLYTAINNVDIKCDNIDIIKELVL